MFPNAKCKGLSIDFFYPKGIQGRKGVSRDVIEKENTGLCWGTGKFENSGGECKDRQKCLDQALELHEDGVYGGTTTLERKPSEGNKRGACFPMPVTFTNIEC